MTSLMKAAVYRAPNEIHVCAVPKPRIGPGEMLLRTWGVGLCGTDINKVHHGMVAPGTVLGHELAGWVAEIGKGVDGFRAGERVAATHHVPCYTCHYCLRGSYSMCNSFKTTDFDPGGLAEYVRLSPLHVRHTTVHLPDSLAFEEAVFIEPLACCLRAVRRAGVRQGDVVWIIGAGSSGLLLALSALTLQACVVVSELIPARLALARELGVHIAAHPLEEDLPAIIRAASQGRGADVIIPTVLSAEIIREVTASVRGGGTVLLFAGEPSQAEMPMDMYGIWRHEVNLISSYSPDPTSLADAYDLIAHHPLHLSRIVSHQVPLSATGQAIQMAMNGQASKVIIRVADG